MDSGGHLIYMGTKNSLYNMHFVQLRASGLKHMLSLREGGLQSHAQGQGWAQSMANCLQTPGYLHKVVEVSETLFF